MSKLFLIALAGFIGTVGRYLISVVIAKRYGETSFASKVLSA
jgi:fluoride ion exporter CrcB/FEX